MALVPNTEQAKIMEKNGYNHHYWLVEYEDAVLMVIIHKTSKETHTIKK